MLYLSRLFKPITYILLIGIYSFFPITTEKKYENETIFLVGSTPGDKEIKTQLGISDVLNVDFIRWDLRINKSNNFELNIQFGESQPNTLGFKNGGHFKNYQGIYTISKNENKVFYQLVANQLKITLIKLNNNLFHLLTASNNLMIGNGGWSYTLNNNKPTYNFNILPSMSSSLDTFNNNLVQVVFDGRTPCQEFANEHQILVDKSCFKLKWKLTLNRDKNTLKPTTYTIRKVIDNVPKDISGFWKIINGTKHNPDAVIYQLDPDKPNQTISLFVADQNILYILHKNESFFIGNENFSFTLNKRVQ